MRSAKLIHLLLLGGLLVTFSVQAQKNKTAVNENKYRINLPDYWGRGNKVWKVLIDRLPQICEELSGKDICGDDCQPKYTVDFYMTEPVVIDYYTQKKNPPLNTRTNLFIKPGDPRYTDARFADYTRPFSNSQNYNAWQVTSYYNFEFFLLLKDETGKILTRMILVDTTETWTTVHDINLTSSGSQNILNYVSDNKDKLLPPDKDLIAIADKKMLDL